MLKNIKRKIKKILTLGVKKVAIAKHFADYLLGTDIPEEVTDSLTNVYYSPVKDKFYFSKDYAPLGKIANRTYYSYIGEL